MKYKNNFGNIVLENKAKFVGLIALALIAISTILYIKCSKETEIYNAHVSRSVEVSDIYAPEVILSNDYNDYNEDFTDVKDFAYTDDLNLSELNSFVDMEKTLQDNFVFVKRDDEINNMKLYVTNKDRAILKTIQLNSNNDESIEVSSIVELADNSLVLKVLNNSIGGEFNSTHLQRYVNDSIAFSNLINDDVDILNLYSSKESNDFATVEVDLDGKVYICRYNDNGNLIFKNSIEHDLMLNVDVILKKDKTLVLSKDEELFILILDNNGDKIQEINIPFENMIVNKLSEVSDGGYLINCINGNGQSIDSTESYIIKVSNKGNVEWSTKEKAHSITKSCFEINDGYLIFNYEFKKQEDSDKVLNMYSVLKVDKKGDILWKRNIGLSDVSNDFIFTTTGEYLDSDCLVINGTLDDIIGNKYLIKIFVDKDGFISNAYTKDDIAIEKSVG